MNLDDLCNILSTGTYLLLSKNADLIGSVVIKKKGYKYKARHKSDKDKIDFGNLHVNLMIPLDWAIFLDY